MPKDRDIVDYLNLGASLVQTAQLGRIRETQSANAEANAARLNLEQLEATAQLNEQRIRSFVFDSTKLVEGLEAKFAASNPVGTLIPLYSLRRNIDRLGINTNAVRSYEDKERVHEYISNVSRVITACEDRLDAAGRETAAMCAKYQAEESYLKALIAYEERLGNIRAREAGMGKMDAPGQIQNLPFPLSLALITTGMLLVLGGFAMVPSSGRWEESTVTVFCFIGAFMVLVVGSWGLFPKGKNAALILQEELVTEQAALARSLSESELQSFRSRFGEGDFEYYRQLHADRAALINSVMDIGQPSDHGQPNA